jgi:GNAT superfamily N-acetyltransferase
MNYQIRAAVPADVPELLQLFREHAAYEQAEYNDNGQKGRLYSALFGENPKLECLVVESEGHLLGYASFMMQFSTWDAADYLHLDCLFLREQARNLGIGQELMQHIRSVAISRNCSLIQWQTPDFNHDAIRFYKRLGAVAKAKQRFFWIP